MTNTAKFSFLLIIVLTCTPDKLLSSHPYLCLNPDASQNERTNAALLQKSLDRRQQNHALNDEELYLKEAMSQCPCQNTCQSCQRFKELLAYLATQRSTC